MSKMYFEGLWSYYHMFRVVETNTIFKCTSHNEDSVTMTPLTANLNEAINSIVFCLENQEDFEAELRKEFGYDKLPYIHFWFNDILISISPKVATSESILKQWKQTASNWLTVRVNHYDIKFINSKEKIFFENFVNTSSNIHAKSIYELSKRWVICMQELMNSYHLPVSKVAGTAYLMSNIDTLEGWIFEEAVALLVKTWEYGFELNDWYLKYGKGRFEIENLERRL